jgi:hypothetical protein
MGPPGKVDVLHSPDAATSGVYYFHGGSVYIDNGFSTDFTNVPSQKDLS